MHVYNELSILHQIGLGLTDIDAIALRTLETKKTVRQIINQLVKGGKINTKNGLSLSKKGLLELSRKIANQESQRSKYIFCNNHGLPYFEHKNAFQRDVIFNPSLFFDPARCYTDDDERNVVYKTSIPCKGFNFEDLEILYNLLYEYEYHHPTGFWLINCESKKLCGWGIKNLRNTLELAEMPFNLKFCCAFTDFIFLINSDIDKSELSRFRINIYITRDSFPYIDTLDNIYDRLKVFMNFHKIQELPRGKELELKNTMNRWGLLEPELRFFSQVLGKILHRNANPWSSFPLVFIITPYRTSTRLKQISPWFVTCPGGCLEHELIAKKAHSIHLLNVVSLPEIDIVSLMINP